jgi:hypothetical protein
MRNCTKGRAAAFEHWTQAGPFLLSIVRPEAVLLVPSVACHTWVLTGFLFSSIKEGSRGCGARGDLRQLAPRKKLLKSWSSFPEEF